MEIYADNAATTRISKKALDTYIKVSEDAFANPSSTHSKGRIAAFYLESARDTIKRLFNAEKDSHIVFTSGGSESDNQAILTLRDYGLKTGKKHIISSEIEHPAVLNSLKRLESDGFEIELIKPDKKGIISFDDIKKALRDTTAGVSVMYANNEIGTIQPVKEIAKAAHEVNAIFHTDAVQAAGHLAIDVQKEGIDLLSISSHKFHGPKGVGALYVKGGISPFKLVEGGSQEMNFRAGTQNVPGIAAMACALEESLYNLDEKSLALSFLRDHVINELLKIDDVIVNGDLKKRLPSNISFSVRGINAESFKYLCQSQGIYISSGSACHEGSNTKSHVLKAIDLDDSYINSTFRLSFDEDFTKDQAKYLIDRIIKNIRQLRSAPLF
ncbi:MAG: cysteine desulfurase family protein [Succinivibrio sp.]